MIFRPSEAQACQKRTSEAGKVAVAEVLQASMVVVGLFKQGSHAQSGVSEDQIHSTLVQPPDSAACRQVLFGPRCGTVGAPGKHFQIATLPTGSLLELEDVEVLGADSDHTVFFFDKNAEKSSYWAAVDVASYAVGSLRNRPAGCHIGSVSRNHSSSFFLHGVS